MNRRHFVTALAAPALLPLANTGGAFAAADQGVRPDSGRDESASLQGALRRAEREGRPLFLSRGDYVVSNIDLPQNVELHGYGARLVYGGGGTLLRARGCDRVRLSGLVLDGAGRRTLDRRAGALDLTDCTDIAIEDCGFCDTYGIGLNLTASGGSVTNCRFERIGGLAAIFSLNATGLRLDGNVIRDAADGGILVHRSSPGPDGTSVTGNTIENIRADSGGTGPYGNGINAYLAHGVQISGNRMTGCAFSAIRCHSATNAIVSHNTALRSGEIALYAEFGFQGAAVANNVVDEAAMGISIANFMQGGRLAVCANNVVRNLRDTGPYPAEVAGFGHGIFVEADTTVSGNVVDGAARWGIGVGWGPYLRNVAVTGNVVRDAGVGVAVSVAEGVGSAIIADNVLRARDGAVVGHAWLERRTGDLTQSKNEIPAGLRVEGNRT